MLRESFYDAAARRLVQIKWLIDGHDNYCFAKNNKCYNRTTGSEVRQLVKGGYTRGYNLKKLRPLLRKV